MTFIPRCDNLNRRGSFRSFGGCPQGYPWTAKNSRSKRPGFFYAPAPASAAALSRSRCAGCKPLHPHPVPPLLPRGDKPAFVNCEKFFPGSRTYFFDTRFSVDTGSPVPAALPGQRNKTSVILLRSDKPEKMGRSAAFPNPCADCSPLPLRGAASLSCSLATKYWLLFR